MPRSKADADGPKKGLHRHELCRSSMLTYRLRLRTSNIHDSIVLLLAAEMNFSTRHDGKLKRKREAEAIRGVGCYDEESRSAGRRGYQNVVR